MNLLTSKMSENNSGCVSSPVIILGKANRVVHEKSVKMQLLQILLAIKPSAHIWTEIILAKYQRPHLKNEREQLWLRRQSSHYIGEVVKVGYWLSVVKWCLKSTQSGSLCCHNIKCAEFGLFGVDQNHPGPFQRVLTNIEIWAE